MVSSSDFGALDEIHFCESSQYRTLLRIARDVGYSFVSECILDLYYNHNKTGYDISNVFRKSMNTAWVYDFIKASGYIVRPQGPRYLEILSTDSYADMDVKINYHHAFQKSQTAKRIGFYYISEAIAELFYTESLPTNVIATTFACTASSISATLRRMNNFPHCKENTTSFSKLSKRQQSQIKREFKKYTVHSWRDVKAFFDSKKLLPAPFTIRKFFVEAIKREKNDRVFVQEKEKRRRSGGSRT